ncbi:GNAT family N-acetyltransferase [Streptomyces sp. NPDC002133]|uniref:GNAT family N-acetyltransferase n=1 Tax=Streptomyces sp. NPDC002133 TaxID=3154409 RepID=UPI0033273230
MTDTSPAPPQAHALLADGTTVRIRTVLPGDRPQVLRLYEGMSPENLRLRFFTMNRDNPRHDADRMCAPAASRRRALLAESGDEVVGLGEYERLTEGTEADVGLAVSDGWHHRGVGTLLLEHLVSLARSDGITAFSADALSENHEVLKVFGDLGLGVSRHFEGPEVRCTVRLTEDETYLSAVDVRPLSAPAPLKEGQAVKHDMVGSVMTSEVVRATYETPFTEVSQLLKQYRISGLPVVDDDEQVLGVVSETDLMLHRSGDDDPESAHRFRRPARTGKARARESGALARNAGQLMTHPAITVHAEQSIAQAARTMAERRVERLPVVDEEDRLVGIVTRRDLLQVFLRPDAEIRGEVIDEVLVRALRLAPATVGVEVRDGVVTLSGQLERRSEMPVVLRMTRQVDGVIDVVDRLSFRVDDAHPQRSVPGSADMPLERPPGL